MTIYVERKQLNEKDYYELDISDDEQEVVSPVDDTVIELLYEILANKY